MVITRLSFWILFSRRSPCFITAWVGRSFWVMIVIYNISRYVREVTGTWLRRTIINSWWQWRRAHVPVTVSLWQLPSSQYHWWVFRRGIGQAGAQYFGKNATNFAPTPCTSPRVMLRSLDPSESDTTNNFKLSNTKQQTHWRFGLFGVVRVSLDIKFKLEYPGLTDLSKDQDRIEEYDDYVWDIWSNGSYFNSN